MKFFLYILLLINIFSLFSIRCVEEEKCAASCLNVQDTQVYDGYEGNNYMVKYFYNLHNFTTNIAGSCAFNAFNMIFDYYDSFWDDDLIPEKYDYNEQNPYDELGYKNSPGSTFQKFYGIVEETPYIFYYHYLNDNNFIKYLIDIALDNGIIKDLKTGGKLGLSYKQMVSFIHLYLEKYNSSNCSFYEVGYDVYRRENMYELDERLTNSQYLEKETIKLVKKGIPVILMLGNDIGAGHAVVAYDYDALNNKIYCHFGYDHKMHFWHKEDYAYIRSMYAIAPISSASHKHSNNYLDFNGKSYCSCQLLTHEHNFEGKSFKNFHDVHCFCGFHHHGNHFVNDKNVCIYCKMYLDDDSEYGAKD